MKRELIFFLILSLTHGLNGQILQKAGDLPSNINESSGLAMENEYSLWTINDGGNPAELFLLDTSANLLRTLKLNGTDNRDWESLFKGDDGSLYIGDFGNNDNVRKDLRIYALTQQQLSQDTASPYLITFEYEDQFAFPPSEEEKRFDCEAMFIFGDSIYLVSKNWTNPFDGRAFLYAFPNAPGHHFAHKLDSFNAGTISLISQITGATIIGKRILLVGSIYIWEFNFNDYPRFEGLMRTELGSLSQKEAITVFGSDRIYISEEKNGATAALYYMDLKASSVEKLNKEEILIRADEFTLHVESSHNNLRSVALLNLSGAIIWNEDLKPNQSKIIIPTNQKGLMLVVVYTDKSIYAKRLMIGADN